MNPGHVVRGIDFSDDPLLQGRLFSYVDTQLNRNGGPNFEQLPINQPRVQVHNNNRDGAGQGLIHLNTIAYGQNSLNNGSPKLANQTQGKGFFTAPIRRVVDGAYVRDVSPTFMDFWTQPRLYWNSLIPAERQMLVNAARFELSKVASLEVRKNVIFQFNRIDNTLARLVAAAIGVTPPQPDSMYYHKNSTKYISIFRDPLPSVTGLNVAILVSVKSTSSLDQAKKLSSSFKGLGAQPIIVGEILQDGVNQTYIAANAVLYDGIIATDGTKDLFGLNSSSTYFPSQIPGNLFRDGYAYGKPVAAIGDGVAGLDNANIPTTGEEGVYVAKGGSDSELSKLVSDFVVGLKRFKFVNRFPIDDEIKKE